MGVVPLLRPNMHPTNSTSIETQVCSISLINEGFLNPRPPAEHLYKYCTLAQKETRLAFSRCRRRRPRANRRCRTGPRAARKHQKQPVSHASGRPRTVNRNLAMLAVHSTTDAEYAVCTDLGDVPADGRIIEVLPLVVEDIVLRVGGVGTTLYTFATHRKDD